MNLRSMNLTSCFFASSSTSFGVMFPLALLPRWLPCRRSARADPDCLLHRNDENLPVADAAGLRALLDRVEHVVHQLVGHHDLELHLGHEVDDVCGATVDLLLSTGAPEPFDLGDGHSLDADLGEGVFHLVELERLDDGFDLLHGSWFSASPDGAGRVPRWRAVVDTGIARAMGSSPLRCMQASMVTYHRQVSRLFRGSMIPATHYPTPAQCVEGLSRPGSTLWIKRDDKTHDLYGGNKVRKLEGILDDAPRARSDARRHRGRRGKPPACWRRRSSDAQAGLDVEAVLVLAGAQTPSTWSKCCARRSARGCGRLPA